MKLRLINILIGLAIISNSGYSFSQGYFQQEVNYKIQVTLNDSTHELYGYEEIEYINNSPDDLELIYFDLWANAFANNNTALANQKFENSG